MAATLDKLEATAVVDDPHRSLRWSIYWLLIVAATAGAAARVLAVRDPQEANNRPFPSANDRSRWAMIRALVERGTYEIDEIIQQPGWDTIDRVWHWNGQYDAQGRKIKRFYSSKPPFYPTLLAGVYAALYYTTGLSLETHPFAVGRGLLLLFNVVPLAVYFWVLARLIDRLGTTDWGRVFAMTAATFGTLVTPFASVLNNHLPAAVTAAVALYAAVRILLDGQRRARYFVLAGLLAALTAANELPALAFVGLLGLVLLVRAPLPTMTFGLPCVLLVAAAFLGTNWIAHGTLIPPYAHRSTENPEDNWYDYPGSYWTDPQKRTGVDRGEPSPLVYAANALVGHHGVFSLTPVWLASAAGVVLAWRRGRSAAGWRSLALLVALTSVVCLAFYLTRPEIDRNYGGVSCGLRWVIWLTPLWLSTLAIAADAATCCRKGRTFMYLALAVSVISATYPGANPWSQPWIQDFVEYLGLGSRL